MYVVLIVIIAKQCILKIILMTNLTKVLDKQAECAVEYPLSKPNSYSCFYCCFK